MIKVIEKNCDFSENVEVVTSMVYCNDTQFVADHKIFVRVTFKDWWNFFIGKDCLHLKCTTTLNYEEINNNKSMSDNTSNNTARRTTPKPKKGKSDTSIGEQSTNIK